MIDSWYSASLYIDPVIRTNRIKMFLPCEKALFEARSAAQWMELLRRGQGTTVLPIEITWQASSFPEANGMIDAYAMHGLLAAVGLRISEAYFRLLSKGPEHAVDRGRIPWVTYASDPQAQLAVPMVCDVIQKYHATLATLNPNCMLFWHNICIMMTVNLQILEKGAGRHGPEPAREALEDIAVWASKPAARRAVLHASQTVKSIIDRRASDGIMFHSITSLFAATLVLGLYVLKMPDSVDLHGEYMGESFDLLDDVDWKAVGHEGLVEKRYNTNVPDNTAIHFIRFGGSISMGGPTLRSGYQSARRLLLDYVSLMEEMEKWKIGRFSQILRIMSDSLG